MRSLTPTSIATLVLALNVAAQTTGIPCCNDYTINGFGSGTTSCTKYINPAGSNLFFGVDTVPTATSVLFVFSTSPCTPGSIVLPGCCGLIQSIDLNLSSTLIFVTAPVITAPGVPCARSFFNVPFCPSGFVFSTQAAVIDPFCPGGIRLTQAYDVCCL